MVVDPLVFFTVDSAASLVLLLPKDAILLKHADVVVNLGRFVPPPNVRLAVPRQLLLQHREAHLLVLRHLNALRVAQKSPPPALGEHLCFRLLFVVARADDVLALNTPHRAAFEALDAPGEVQHLCLPPPLATGRLQVLHGVMEALLRRPAVLRDDLVLHPQLPVLEGLGLRQGHNLLAPVHPLDSPEAIALHMRHVVGDLAALLEGKLPPPPLREALQGLLGPLAVGAGDNAAHPLCEDLLRGSFIGWLGGAIPHNRQWHHAGEHLLHGHGVAGALHPLELDFQGVQDPRGCARLAGHDPRRSVGIEGDSKALESGRNDAVVGDGRVRSSSILHVLEGRQLVMPRQQLPQQVAIAKVLVQVMGLSAQQRIPIHPLQEDVRHGVSSPRGPDPARTQGASAACTETSATGAAKSWAPGPTFPSENATGWSEASVKWRRCLWSRRESRSKDETVRTRTFLCDGWISASVLFHFSPFPYFASSFHSSEKARRLEGSEAPKGEACRRSDAKQVFVLCEKGGAAAADVTNIKARSCLQDR
eukprot:scaffold1661_cov251-Pinguiococcus_pyrenoidosus.AAC.59